jgi:peptidyl-prolyl cis-trans isomerase C
MLRLGRRVLREPLLHFLGYGAALFLIGQALHSRSDMYRIVVTPGQQAVLAKQYAAQFGIRPDPTLLRTILAGWIHDEMLYREGIALGVDKHDQVVRERVVQKMKFVMEDVAPPPEPTIIQLEAYYRAHADRYILPAAASFTHIYFSVESGRLNAERRAQRALVELRTRARSRYSWPGDAFPDRHDFSAATERQVQGIFGDTTLTREIFAAPVSRWVGPYESAYGIHLLYVYGRTPRQREPFAEARAAVREDYLADAQRADNKADFERLARKFRVVPDNRNPFS